MVLNVYISCILYEYICSILQLCSANIDNLYSYLNPTNTILKMLYVCATRLQMYNYMHGSQLIFIVYVFLYVCMYVNTIPCSL